MSRGCLRRLLVMSVLIGRAVGENFASENVWHVFRTWMRGATVICHVIAVDGLSSIHKDECEMISQYNPKHVPILQSENDFYNQCNQVRGSGRVPNHREIWARASYGNYWVFPILH